jgi:hypothetical protein
MIEQAMKTKTPMINITINEDSKAAQSDKENKMRVTKMGSVRNGQRR